MPNRRTLVLAGMFLLALIAARFYAIAIFSSLALLIGSLTLQRPFSKALIAGLVVMTVLNGFAMVQFVIKMAVSGVVAGGERALTRSAVSNLRKIVFAQDIARQRALVDPDHDGVGSALTFRGLVEGTRRDGTKAAPFLLRFDVAEDVAPADVVARRDGYLFALYLPRTPAGAIDEERAERRFVAYAWPERAGQFTEVVYVDEHERIFVSDNTAATQRYLGLQRRPAAEAALTAPGIDAAPGERGRDAGVWRAWKGKRPRKQIVGDR